MDEPLSKPVNPRSFMLAVLFMAVSIEQLSPQVSMQSAEVALDRIQHRVSESLYGLPNYTCRLDIRRVERVSTAGELARSRRSKKEGKRRQNASQESADAISFDVVVIDGKEHYSLPGEPNLESRPPSELVERGMTSTGAFASFARDIIVNRVGAITLVGQENLFGAQARRYDYDVAQSRSQYRLTNDGQSVLVPYRGSFWITVDGEDLLRLTAEVDEVPLFVGVHRVTTQVDYQSVDLAGRRAIVARRVRVDMHLADGQENVNDTEFTDCRSFDSSSAVTF